MNDVTEEGVAVGEELVSIMRDEEMRLLFDQEKCRSISIVGYRSLQKGNFAADDAIDLVLGALTHVLGGRFVANCVQEWEVLDRTGVATDSIGSTDRLGSLLHD
jgi:hypothetical protein